MGENGRLLQGEPGLSRTYLETRSAAAPMARYIFHSIAADSYSWCANQSFDRGATWTKQWIIDAERKEGAELPGAVSASPAPDDELSEAVDSL